MCKLAVLGLFFYPFSFHDSLKNMFLPTAYIKVISVPIHLYKNPEHLTLFTIVTALARNSPWALYCCSCCCFSPAAAVKRTPLLEIVPDAQICPLLLEELQKQEKNILSFISFILISGLSISRDQLKVNCQRTLVYIVYWLPAPCLSAKSKEGWRWIWEPTNKYLMVDLNGLENLLLPRYPYKSFTHNVQNSFIFSPNKATILCMN